MPLDTQAMIPAWVAGRLAPMGKLDVHRRGLRHKAISVFVLNGPRVLIQRRAAVKYHTPGLWANTCCTHPNWGEDDAVCAARRLEEELGITGLSLHHAGEVIYRADVGGGLIEHEVVQVYTAQAPAGMRIAPDPDEVSATAWVDLHTLAAEVRRAPERFTPWLRIYLSRHMSMIFGDLGLKVEPLSDPKPATALT